MLSVQVLQIEEFSIAVLKEPVLKQNIIDLFDTFLNLTMTIPDEDSDEDRAFIQ